MEQMLDFPAPVKSIQLLIGGRLLVSLENGDQWIVSKRKPITLKCFAASMIFPAIIAIAVALFAVWWPL